MYSRVREGAEKGAQEAVRCGDQDQNVIVDESDGFLSKIKLTATQVKRLQAKERSEKQKAQLAELKEKNRLAKVEAKKNLDMRTDKSKPGVTIAVQPPAKPRGRHVAKPKPLSPPESEEEEPEPVKKFQAKKPKMEEDELEQKVAKLNKLNQVIESNNPWLARIMETRRR